MSNHRLHSILPLVVTEDPHSTSVHFPGVPRVTRVTKEGRWPQGLIHRKNKTRGVKCRTRKTQTHLNKVKPHL